MTHQSTLDEPAAGVAAATATIAPIAQELDDVVKEVSRLGSYRQVPAADGLHLASRNLVELRRRPDEWSLVGASCHGAADLAWAAALGLDYALLSPVLPTASHPGAPPLGWERFAALAEEATLPVYALGGLGPGEVEQAIDHGAQGVAAIRGLWPD